MTNLESASTGSRAVLSDDLSRYRRHVDHLDLPEERKAELLRAVWHIMGSFVDRAFGDDPAQLALKGGDENHLPRETGAPAVVSSKGHNNPGETALTEAFAKRAGRKSGKETR